jgi:hypothetical protein
MIDTNLKEFIEDLSWLNVEKPMPIIIIFGIRRIDSNEIFLDKTTYSSSIKKISHIRLFDEEENWPVYFDVFDVYLTEEFTSLQLYTEMIEYFLNSVLKQGAMLSWCMFEGGFVNINNLFSDWGSESTYAFCCPENKPEFAIERKKGNRKSGRINWRT